MKPFCTLNTKKEKHNYTGILKYYYVILRCYFKVSSTILSHRIDMANDDNYD